MASVDDIRGGLRLDDDQAAGDPLYDRAARLAAWATAEIERKASGAPAAVKTQAVGRWVAYLLDSPWNGVSNAYTLSGAGALLRPWARLPVAKIAAARGIDVAVTEAQIRAELDQDGEFTDAVTGWIEAADATIAKTCGAVPDVARDAAVFQFVEYMMGAHETPVVAEDPWTASGAAAFLARYLTRRAVKIEA